MFPSGGTGLLARQREGGGGVARGPGRRRWEMKLIIAVVQDRDRQPVVLALLDHGFRVTQLASTGGFLREGNSTLIMGVDDERVDIALSIFRRTCSSRSAMMATHGVAPAGAAAGMPLPVPVEVTVGGAVLFVLPMDYTERV